ncbi:hypothetical protein, partial [Streptomyces sp. NPDC051098]|uniref:hypothetical protein n=1 Tax=Streptomyces sp. NPDC051098 TaxID=3155411 RepID=UPI00342E67ED
EIAKASRAVVVEGYTDVMACHLAGVTTAIATDLVERPPGRRSAARTHRWCGPVEPVDPSSSTRSGRPARSTDRDGYGSTPRAVGTGRAAAWGYSGSAQTAPGERKGLPAGRSSPVA